MEHRTISLAEQVFERLENDILCGKYKRGEILTEIMLGVGDDGGEHFLTQQDDADDGEDVCSILPSQVVCHDQSVDGIYRLVQHHGIDLCDERPYQRQNQRQYDEPFVRLHIGLYFLE